MEKWFLRVAACWWKRILSFVSLVILMIVARIAMVIVVDKSGCCNDIDKTRYRPSSLYTVKVSNC